MRSSTQRISVTVIMCFCCFYSERWPPLKTQPGLLLCCCKDSQLKYSGEKHLNYTDDGSCALKLCVCLCATVSHSFLTSQIAHSHGCICVVYAVVGLYAANAKLN